MSTQSLTNEIGVDEKREEGKKEGRLTVPCNEERGSVYGGQRGQKKDFGRRSQQTWRTNAPPLPDYRHSNLAVKFRMDEPQVEHQDFGKSLRPHVSWSY